MNDKKDHLFKFIVILFCISSCLSCKDRIYDTNVVRNKRTNVSTTIKSTNLHNSLTGKVTKISDGDTFSLLFDNGFTTKVRLNGIDCPEKKQAYSNKAKTELSDLIYEKEVLVKYDKKDGYGRVLGDVFIDDLNVNQEMVRKGLAWHYKKYSDDVILAQLEDSARVNKIGLWAETNPIAPWEFRHK